MINIDELTVTWPWHGRAQDERTLRERFQGCLLGGAVGDALGAPVEFMRRKQILEKFGPEGITEYSPAYGGLGKITDDTQMTLFTADGLIRGWLRGRMRGLTSYEGTVAHAYQRWLLTQGAEPCCDASHFMEEPGWLFRQKELHSLRAPGNTCLSGLSDKVSPTDPATNHSKGCGGVMRMAPVGLFGWNMKQAFSLDRLFDLGTTLAALSHGHPTGSLTAGVFGILILALVDGAELEEGLEAAKRILRTRADHEETLRAIEDAQALAREGVPHAQAIERLGEGWVADEALSVSIYCALVARDFREGIILAVNHDGDTDSTGAIAGNLLGAKLGIKAIPESWLEPLELRSVITEIADDLFEFSSWQMDEYMTDEALREETWKKYPWV